MEISRGIQRRNICCHLRPSHIAHDAVVRFSKPIGDWDGMTTRLTTRLIGFRKIGGENFTGCELALREERRAERRCDRRYSVDVERTSERPRKNSARVSVFCGPSMSQPHPARGLKYYRNFAVYRKRINRR